MGIAHGTAGGGCALSHAAAGRLLACMPSQPCLPPPAFGGRWMHNPRTERMLSLLRDPAAPLGRLCDVTSALTFHGESAFVLCHGHGCQASALPPKCCTPS